MSKEGKRTKEDGGRRVKKWRWKETEAREARGGQRSDFEEGGGG